MPTLNIKNTTLDDIAHVIGFTPTLRICAWFGGLGNLYVPLALKESQLLARLVGTTSAQRLIDEWGGEHIAIPMLSQYDEDLLSRRVGRLLEHGMSAREVASSMRISQRRVHQICRDLEVAGVMRVIGPGGRA